MPDRSDYLAQLEAELPMPPDARGEVLDEISAHLDDVAAERIAAGKSAAEAEADAQRRLGPPGMLARDLARAQQTRWRLLAAAGSGTRAAIGPAVYGYLLGVLAISAVWLAIGGVLQLVVELGGPRWTPNLDPGWTSAMFGLAVASAAYFAGRRVPPAFSLASRRSVSQVLPWVATFGTGVLAVLCIFVVEVSHNWASVVAFSLAPYAFALGAYRPRLLPDPIRLSWVAIAGLLVVVMAVGLYTADVTAGGAVEVSEPEPAADRGDVLAALIGPRWPAMAEAGSLMSSVGWSAADGTTRVEYHLAAGATLSGLTDPRVEAWRTLDEHPWLLDTRHDSPFATAPVERSGRVLAAEIDVTSTPGVTSWELVLTATGPDGARYIVDSGMGGVTSFQGTVWDWLVTVVRGVNP